jgi:hypothetical protein
MSFALCWGRIEPRNGRAAESGGAGGECMKTVLGALMVLAASIQTSFVIVPAIARAETSAELTRVTGTVGFERRFTIVPLAICEKGTPCPESKPYWVLTVKGGGMLYEVDQTFSEGSIVAPASVEFQSVILQPGDRISLEGQVRELTRGLAQITQVRSVALIPRPAFFGWTCHTLSTHAQRLYVDVIQISRQGGFNMRIQSPGETGADPIQTLASFTDVSLRMGTDRIEFQGGTHALSAALSIDQSEASQMNDFISVLRITERGLASSSPVESRIELACNPTR